MGENRSLLTALGAILGLILFIYVIMQGVSYFQQGTAEFDEMQRQAGKPILLSETLHETDAAAAGSTEEVATEASSEITATITTTETTLVETTPAVSTEITATTEMSGTAVVTETSAAVAATEVVTATDTVTGSEGITATAVMTDDGAIDDTAAMTTTAATETTAETASEETVAPVDEAVALAAPAPEAVTPIFTKAGCIGCHVIPNIPNAVGAVGPDLSEIGLVGATRIEGYTAPEYIRESILDPNAFLAPECPAGPCLPGLMVQNLGEILTAEEIDAVVAYLSTLGVAK